jgi:hypothetical protein
VADALPHQDTSTIEAQRIANMADGVRRERAVEDFHRAHYSAYAVVARRFRQKAGIDKAHVDDLGQIIALVADGLIRDAKVWESGSMFLALLQRRTSSKLRDWSFTADNTGLGGGTAAMRRRLLVAKVSRELATELGRQPTDEEVVEAANHDQAMRMSTPGKAGRITTDDVTGVKVTATDIPEDILGGHLGPRMAGEGDLDPTEMGPFAELVIARATEERGELFGSLAAIYLSGFIDEATGFPPDMKDLAPQFDRSVDWVRRSIHEIHVICRSVLEDDFGIKRPPSDFPKSA